jgi:hypothetical protein
LITANSASGFEADEDEDDGQEAEEQSPVLKAKLFSPTGKALPTY